MTTTGQRPRGSGDRTRWIQVRVSPDEQVRMRDLADAAGLSVSELVRARVLGPDTDRECDRTLAVGVAAARR